MVDPTSKSKQGKNQSSPQDLTPLSVFLNFKIQWPAETVNKEISSEKYLEESKRSLILPGVAPDRFFLKSKSNGIFDTAIEQISDHKRDEAEAASTKDVAALGDQDLFQNVQSSKPAVSSSEHKTAEVLSGWAADFQFADTDDQLGGHTSSKHVTASSEGSETKFKDPESFHSSSGLNVDLSAHLDSVFGPGENLNDGKPKESSSIPAASGDWNSDDMWNNLTSSVPNLSDGFNATLNEQTPDLSTDLSTTTSVDLFQDFQSQTNYVDMTKNKTTIEEHTAMDEDIFDDWNDFASSTSLQAPSQNAWAGSNDQVSTSEDKPSTGDFFSFDNKLEGEKKFSEGDLFSFDNKFEDDKKSSERDLFSFENKFEGEKKSLESDLFSFDNNFGGDFSGSSQPNLFSSSTNQGNAPTEGSAIMSENDASNWFSDPSNSTLESGQTANSGDALGQSTKDDVKMLISQMHDLSFMLETDLSIPSSSNEHKSVQND